MGAKKIRRRGSAKPNLYEVFAEFEAVGKIASDEVAEYPNMAPLPRWQLTQPLSRDPNGYIPAIRPEDVDPMVVITDAHVVKDFEATGLKLARIDNPNVEKLLLWMIDKSRDLEQRDKDTEFAIDLAPDLANRSMGKTLADLARKGRLRIIATRDDSKVIVQMIFTPEELADREGAQALYERCFPEKQPQ